MRDCEAALAAVEIRECRVHRMAQGACGEHMAQYAPLWRWRDHRRITQHMGWLVPSCAGGSDSNHSPLAVMFEACPSSGWDWEGGTFDGVLFERALFVQFASRPDVVKPPPRASLEPRAAGEGCVSSSDDRPHHSAVARERDRNDAPPTRATGGEEACTESAVALRVPFVERSTRGFLLVLSTTQDVKSTFVLA